MEKGGYDMSYCRWSSDDWKCDLYCYHSVCGNFITHVAGRKHIGVPVNPHKITDKEYWLAHQSQMEFLETAEMKDIGLPYDSEHFQDPDLESFLQRVNCLKEAGYHVPVWVLESIEEEIT
jgi:hypothetical protein